MEARLLTLDAAAAYCGLPKRAFRHQVRERRLPAPVRLGSRELWDRGKLDEYIDALHGTSSAGRRDWNAALEKF